MPEKSENIQRLLVIENSNTNMSESALTTTIVQVTFVITLIITDLSYESSKLEELYISTLDLLIIV